MRIHCKVVAIAVGFGVFLLVYLFGGNGGADEPPPKEVGGDRELEEVGRSPPSLLSEYVGSDAVAKLARKSATGVGERVGRKEGKATGREGSVNAKSKFLGKVIRPVTRRRRPEEVMHLAVVACGKRLDETLTMLKSALLFSLKKIKFHIFAEDSLAPEFEERVILKDVDSLLYVDTDVLFLRPMDDIWMFLKSFNGSQLAAMAPEHEVSKIGWYSRFARHPFYGVTGVNSGVMLMNLTRIRRTLFKSSLIAGGLLWEDLLHPLHQKYKNYITWGDQDLLNIIFHYNPENLYIFPCQWNYRPDHCMYGSNCKGAEQEGVSILHGNRGVYHDDKQPAFKVVYDAIHNFPFEDNMFQSLFYPIQNKFLDTVNTLCGRIPQVFLKQIENAMKTVFEANVVRHVRPHK
ncbi:PREDICTED: glucoside xylosyltransferase 2 isoform X3 [Poecilia mexicana]|uniref:glucoside xylosyltransferase 2 isoform X3 n=1 Tax=Poecilia mexicana TaxID=48701 RepID=UPI00072DAEF2|nr:PREDICTED: glucoside xylosyltransferase 2 isoform X3 [Poecilia mexicana]